MPNDASPVVRRATPADLPAVAKLAGALVRQHHAFDPLRFMLPEHVEDGYRRWFGRELQNPDAVILAAALGDAIAGYAYGRLEERDWNALRDECGALHDIYVDDAARGRGVGEQLVNAFLAEMKQRGAPRVVLSTAWPNAAAQRLFKRCGFRETMIEMTRELGDGFH